MAKKKRGRPPKKLVDRKLPNICLRMTAAEKAKLKREAKEKGVTLTQFLLARPRVG